MKKNSFIKILFFSIMAVVIFSLSIFAKAEELPFKPNMRSIMDSYGFEIGGGVRILS